MEEKKQEQEEYGHWLDCPSLLASFSVQVLVCSLADPMSVHP